MKLGPGNTSGTYVGLIGPGSVQGNFGFILGAIALKWHVETG